MTFCRNLFLIAFLLHSSGTSLAQNPNGIVLQRQTISTMGGSANAKNVFVSHTAGQSSAHTQNSYDGLKLSQGFEQGAIVSSARQFPAIQLWVYPNPNNGTFFLKSDLPHGVVYSVQIFDIQGRVLFTRTAEGGIEQVFTLASELASGIYTLSLQTAVGSRKETKVVIL